ncbi:MAG: hypothetical protein ACW96U_12345, partial [Candidatus Heimdallarchaeaceae archaeon]
MTENSKQELYQPTIKDILLLPLIGDVKANNNGTKVAYRKGNVNLKDNKIDIYCCIYDLEKEESYYLTKTGAASNFHWINNESLAVLKSTELNGSQIFAFEGLIGEGLQVTDHKGGIKDFYPFADGFVYIANNLDNVEIKKRKSRFGKFVHVEEEKSTSSLFFVDTAKMKEY